MSNVELGRIFPTDEPVAAGDLVGRTNDVQALTVRLGEHVNTIIAGPRRTGKTSVCRSALERRRKAGTYVCAVDLFYLSDTAALAEALVLAAISNRSAVRRALDRARRGGRQIADLISGTVSAKLRLDLGEEVEIAWRPRLAEEDPEAALRYALGLPARIAAADERQVVCFFDEFQEIAHPRRPYGDSDALAGLIRSVVQDSPRVTYLFAGSLEHLMLALFGPARSPLAGVGSFFGLGPIETDEWLRGLGERFERAGLSADQAEVHRLLDLSGGHPRSTMLLARETAQAARGEGEDRIAGQHVLAGLDGAMASERPRHEAVLSRIREIRHGQRIAQRIALGQHVYKNASNKAIHDALKRLRDAGIVDQPAPRTWRIADPLLARFLASLPS